MHERKCPTKLILPLQPNTEVTNLIHLYRMMHVLTHTHHHRHIAGQVAAWEGVCAGLMGDERNELRIEKRHTMDKKRNSSDTLVKHYKMLIMFIIKDINFQFMLAHKRKIYETGVSYI